MSKSFKGAHFEIHMPVNMQRVQEAVLLMQLGHADKDFLRTMQ